VDVRGLAFGLDVWARAALETSTPITAAAVATLRFISLSLAVTPLLDLTWSRAESFTREHAQQMLRPNQKMPTG
jgi:hypothetical protein